MIVDMSAETPRSRTVFTSGHLGEGVAEETQPSRLQWPTMCGRQRAERGELLTPLSLSFVEDPDSERDYCGAPVHAQDRGVGPH